ncbi:MAG: PAS-domain containing protein, partial [Rubrivivax sp.]|nr:PAS-domain containing protein [Rubrivivax sp.]
MPWDKTSKPAALTLLVAVAGLTASVGAALHLQQRQEQDAAADFQRAVDGARLEIAQRFVQPLNGLRGARGLYAASEHVDRDEFRRFVQAQAIDTTMPGVRGLGFVRRVSIGDETQYLAEQRADAAPDFTIRELAPSARGERYVVQHIEPLLRNRQAWGLDLGSEVRRRHGIERAVASGQPSLTDPIVLLQDERRRPGLLLFLPVYGAGSEPAALAGLLYAPIVIDELLGGLGTVRTGRLDLELFAAEGTADADRVYGASPAAGRRFQQQASLPVPGRTFTLRATATPDFEAAWSGNAAWIVLAGGLLLTALLSYLAHQSAVGRWRAEALAQGMTQDLDRLAHVVRLTHDAVMLLDDQRRITWVNDAFTRNTGYLPHEAVGLQPSVLLRSECIDPAALARLRAASDAGQAWCGELHNLRKDGRDYWVEVELQPLHDAQGDLSGFMAVESDITERRRAAEALAAATRENEALLRTLHTHAIVSVTDADGRITDVNDMFCAISGYARDELLGQPHRIINSGVHDAPYWAALWERIRSGQAWRGQVCNRARDGALYWVDSIVAPFADADGRVEKFVSIGHDISASRRAMAELTRERERLALIVEGTGAGTWEVDLRSGESQNSPASAAMLGESTDSLRERAQGSFLNLVHPDDRAAVERARQAHFDGDTPLYEVEFRMRHRDGRWVWVLTRGRVGARDAAGQPLRMAGIHFDISARRAMADELRRNNELMTSIVENLPCGLSVFDQRLELVASNRQYRQLLDLPDTLFDTPRPSFESFIRFNAERGEYGPGDVEQIVAAAVERVRGPAAPHRFERERRDGTPIEVRGAPMPGGGFVTTYTDISQRRQAERESQRSAALLRGAIDAIDEAFVLFDPDDRLVMCNDKYKQVYAGVADLIQPGAHFADLVRAGAERGGFAAATDHVDAWVAERVAAHQAANSTVIQPLANGNTLRIIERKLPDGHIVGFRIDITEHVRAAEAAQQASLAKGRFLANMSHEIRTPMNAILGMLALLRKTDLTGRQADYAAKTEGAARSLLGLLNDILDFSKAEAGKMELDPQPFRIDTLLRDLSVILSVNAGGKPVEVLYDLDPALPRALLGDAMRLQQVLINLGGNAIKFTENGEVVLAVRVVARGEDEVTLEFSVRDTGIGIAPENQRRIFEGFTQAEASTTRRFGGSGLGVAICQRLVRLMGGELALESRPGHGSRFHFRITLPLAEAAAAPRPAPAMRLRALIVDDNPSARELLQAMAESLGWQAELAASGEQALEQLQSGAASYDAVFVDWQMPGLDGWQTCERIRAQALAGQAPLVVMVTAHGRELLAQRSDSEQRMLDGFLVKPITASMLYDAVMDARSASGAAPARAAPLAVAGRLVGLRLLVAEDNANNQQVARELLEDEGAQVQIAPDGLAAVQAVAQAEPPFDAVLMDLQMPVMDGYAATGHIRQLPGRSALPIVAMTANAMASDREACLAAGMNEHVGKPFDLDQLVRVLRRLCQHSVAAAAAPMAAAAAPDAVLEQAAAEAGVELAAALTRLGGNRHAYRRLLRQCAQDLAEQPA